jgi:Formate dehydrogenase N, transmembrane
VVYVLHDAENPEYYGGLPKNPVIPWSYTVWKWLAKPVLGALALFGGLGVLLHYVTVGPRQPQPEPPVKKEASDGNRG